MLDIRIARHAERSAMAVGRIIEPADPGYKGPAAVCGRQAMSAQRREGPLIARSIYVAFNASPRYLVLRNVRVSISDAVRTMAAAGFANGRTHMSRCRDGKAISVDLVVLDQVTGVVYFLEVKRGVRNIGADHMQRLMSNWEAIELIGRDVAQDLFGHPVHDLQVLLLSYYGKTGGPSEHTVTGANLDSFFGVPIQEYVEAHLQFFRHCIDKHVPGLTGYTRHGGGASPRSTA